MLLLDGVKYLLQTPTDEESFEATVREHAKEIFGETTVCFDLKHKLTSKTGIGSIPDAYVVDFSNPPKWYIVEVELASHPVDEHIMPQLNRFMRGIRNADSQKEVSDAIHSEIDENKMLRTLIETKIGSKEIHRFLSDLISIPPEIIVVIDERTEKLTEALEAFKYELKITELKTFVRENAEKVHIHMFEPIKASITQINDTGPSKPSSAALTEGVRVFLKYKANKYEGTFDITAKKITYKGKQYTPSALSVEITKTSRNGWRDWKYIDEQGNERLIDELR